MPKLSENTHSGIRQVPGVRKGLGKRLDIAETFGSLSIDMVEVEDQEAKNAGLPLFPREQILNNWTSIELSVVFKFQNE